MQRNTCDAVTVHGCFFVCLRFATAKQLPRTPKIHCHFDIAGPVDRLDFRKNGSFFSREGGGSSVICVFWQFVVDMGKSHYGFKVVRNDLKKSSSLIQWKISLSILVIAYRDNRTSRYTCSIC
jgi:hypothetical protein